MNKLLLLSGLFVGLSVHSQTTIFQDDFESGSGNWTLNSNDQGGAYVSNHWAINNSYAGGSGSFTCMGIPLAFSIGVTPSQPAGISTPNGNYMHISSYAGDVNGVTNANFIASDGFCNFAESNFTKMTNAISTVGYSNVTLSFWELVGGEAGAVVGEIYYSLDNGSSWILKIGGLNSITTWTSNTLTDAAWDNVASLKIAFRFLNGTGTSPIDPSFSIDDVKITGTSGASAAVATGAITTTTFCTNASANISVPFTVTGTVNAGNVYTAQLSDNSGSFAAPTAIGTLTSSSTGTLSIAATIPSGLSAGTGYRIRVDASDPATVGADNGMDIMVVAPPSVSVTSVPTNGTICSGSSASLTASGATVFGWSPAGSLNSATGPTVMATPTSTQVYTVIGTNANGCSNSATFTVTVQNCAGLEEESFGDFELYPNPVSQLLNVNFGELKGIQTLTVLDLAGRKVLSNKVTSSVIDMGSLESGKYFLMIEHSAGVSVKAFVKQ
jgi:hypothetical protein